MDARQKVVPRLDFRQLLTLILLIFCQETAHGADNNTFAFGLAGVRPVMWKDYEPLQKDSIACIKDNRSTTPVCERVKDRAANILWDALTHAVLINAASRDKGPYFCDKFANDLIKEQKFGEGAAYAVLLIDERLKYGSSLYGPKLPSTYLAKLVFDALVDNNPCKK